jgi:NAD(P)-dependent dehydrogenase (short-subunit alcohol dehydrogenase family)
MSIDYFSVEGKVVVVTGGLGQLGSQFSLSLLERGAKVAVIDMAADGADQILIDSGGKNSLLVLQADITKKNSLDRALQEIVSKWDVPEALINNAALDSPPNAPASENGPFEDYPESSWDRILEVNVKGTFLACQVFGGIMAKAEKGSIVNICSTYGLVSPDQRVYEYRNTAETPFYKPVSYSTSKSALVNLTRYLATYWAPRNVRVNTLTFGGVYNRQDPQFLEGYCARVPMGRMAREDEYNAAVIFLISNASSYMTGSNLVIDGGWTAW